MEYRIDGVIMETTQMSKLLPVIQNISKYGTQSPHIGPSGGCTYET